MRGGVSKQSDRLPLTGSDLEIAMGSMPMDWTPFSSHSYIISFS